MQMTKEAACQRVVQAEKQGFLWAWYIIYLISFMVMSTLATYFLFCYRGSEIYFVFRTYDDLLFTCGEVGDILLSVRMKM